MQPSVSFPSVIYLPKAITRNICFQSAIDSLHHCMHGIKGVIWQIVTELKTIQTTEVDHHL